MRTDESIELKIPPPVLHGNHVNLHFIEIKPGDSVKGHVPFYHFRIVNNGNNVGHINFRVGDTAHITCCAGHLGYEVMEEFRGNSFAFHACRVLAPFVRSIYTTVLLTSAPENRASIRTIEKLGCIYIDEIAIVESEEAYKNGERTKKRYQWQP